MQEFLDSWVELSFCSKVLLVAGTSYVVSQGPYYASYHSSSPVCRLHKLKLNCIALELVLLREEGRRAFGSQY